MQIEINQQTVQEAINSKINQAVVDAIGSYNVSAMISEKLAEFLSRALIIESIDKAFDNNTREKMVAAVSDQIIKTTVKSVNHVMMQTTAKMIVDMKGIQTYETEKYKKAMLEVLAELNK